MTLRLKLVLLSILIGKQILSIGLEGFTLEEKNAHVSSILKDFDYNKGLKEIEKREILLQEKEKLLKEIAQQFDKTKINFQFKPYQSISLELDFFILQEVIKKCPQLLLEDIATLSHISHNPLSSLHFLNHNEINRILLVGPPGSGKSTLALAIAYQCRRPYLFLSAASLANEYKNSAITILNDLFDPVIQSQESVVIILDEITAFTNRFTNNHDSDPGAVEHFWIKLDDCKKNPNILIICTANSTEKIPATIKDRFAGSEFYIALPDYETRKIIFYHYLSSYHTFKTSFLNKLTKKTEGFSLREITMVIKRAKNNAFSRELKARDKTPVQPIIERDIELALHHILDDHNKALHSQRLNKFKEILGYVGPYIIPSLSLITTIAMQWQLNKHTITKS